MTMLLLSQGIQQRTPRAESFAGPAQQFSLDLFGETGVILIKIPLTGTISTIPILGRSLISGDLW
jgi:hypothetical protein